MINREKHTLVAKCWESQTKGMTTTVWEKNELNSSWELIHVLHLIETLAGKEKCFLMLKKNPSTSNVNWVPIWECGKCSFCHQEVCYYNVAMRVKYSDPCSVFCATVCGYSTWQVSAWTQGHVTEANDARVEDAVSSRSEEVAMWNSKWDEGEGKIWPESHCFREIAKKREWIDR